jgi:hypothetical protein
MNWDNNIILFTEHMKSDGCDVTELVDNFDQKFFMQSLMDHNEHTTILFLSSSQSSLQSQM